MGRADPGLALKPWLYSVQPEPQSGPGPYRQLGLVASLYHFVGPGVSSQKPRHASRVVSEVGVCSDFWMIQCLGLSVL